MPRHPRRSLARRGSVPWSLVLLLVVAGCTASVPSSRSSQAPMSRSAGPGGASTELDWKPCEDSYECATLTVPLDWNEPEGTSIDLALLRQKARKPDPIGSLLINPGGPGEPGTDFLPMWLDTGEFPDELADRFDLVSWDPRGTGDSAGIACLTEAEFTEPDPLPYPPSSAERDKVIAQSEGIDERCMESHGEVIPHVGTRSTVEDLDAIREAVGDPGLTYVGYSYGTTIGLEYLHTYPQNVRAVVLDGVALPGTDPTLTTKAQMQSFEDNLGLFLDDCKKDTSCGFGGSDPQKALDDFLDDLSDGTRLPASYQLPDDSGTMHSRDGTLGYTEAVTGIATALYNQESWIILRSGLTLATQKDDPDGYVLLMLRDLLTGRQLDGTWNHSSEANASIGCADQSERSTSFFGDVDRIEEWGEELPVFGRFGAVGLPGCFDLPEAIDPLTELTKKDLADAPDVVVVNSEHDPATPYANALEAVSLLPHVSLVTWGGEDHTAFGSGFKCVDDAVVPYLIDQTMPSAEVRCDP